MYSSRLLSFFCVYVLCHLCYKTEIKTSNLTFSIEFSLEINENNMERIQYLKTTLQTMTKRDKILQDINETNKLSNGSKTFITLWVVFIYRIHMLIRFFFFD